ncbi:hypothetical protein [Streptomyces sp. NPDC050564]|uniref:hypothetical protein n=1 Tax=Streptomyces sp. NPDC050564 TaxID=3365631 RepID=UPI0037966A86
MKLLADTNLAAARGDWYTDSTDLRQLIGRPSTPLATAVADALKAGPADTFDPRGRPHPGRAPPISTSRTERL